MNIAVVSTGLSHVKRGIETWAESLSDGLLAAGSDVTLFRGSGGERRVHECVVPGAPRGSRSNACLTRILSRLGGWRYGCGAPYQTEQTFFFPALLRHLQRAARSAQRDGEQSRNGYKVTGLQSDSATKGRDVTEHIDPGPTTTAHGSPSSPCHSVTLQPCRSSSAPYDIVHLQDPWLARLLEKARQRGWHRAEVILAHGTGEEVSFLETFPHLQELSAPYMQRHAGRAVPPGWTRHVVPNFVDASGFSPGEPAAGRRHFGIPEKELVILSVGAINAAHKQMHRLIEHFADSRVDGTLVIAGTPDGAGGEAIVRKGKERLGERLRVISVKHSDMPLLYRAADVFCLCSLEELFGIVFLEAMASGIPCIGHTYPTTQWIIGAGGACVDMTRPDALAAELVRMQDGIYRSEKGRLARQRVEQMFSKEVVIPQIIKMYEDVCGQSDRVTGGQCVQGP